jgi:hypothetical protein
LFFVLFKESHDIALALQHKIESLEEVERAFVHVDHLTRDGLEHKVERELVLRSQNKVSAKDSTSDSENDYDPNSSGQAFGLRARSKGRENDSLGSFEIE